MSRPPGVQGQSYGAGLHSSIDEPADGIGVHQVPKFQAPELTHSYDLSTPAQSQALGTMGREESYDIRTPAQFQALDVLGLEETFGTQRSLTTSSNTAQSYDIHTPAQSQALGMMGREETVGKLWSSVRGPTSQSSSQVYDIRTPAHPQALGMVGREQTEGTQAAESEVWWNSSGGGARGASGGSLGEQPRSLSVWWSNSVHSQPARGSERPAFADADTPGSAPGSASARSASESDPGSEDAGSRGPGADAGAGPPQREFGFWDVLWPSVRTLWCCSDSNGKAIGDDEGVRPVLDRVPPSPPPD